MKYCTVAGKTVKQQGPPRPRVLAHLFERARSVVPHPTRQNAIGRCEQLRNGVAMIFVPRSYLAHMPRLRAQPTAKYYMAAGHLRCVRLQICVLRDHSAVACCEKKRVLDR